MIRDKYKENFSKILLLFLTGIIVGSLSIIPMVFMFIVTLVALGLLIKTNLFSATPNYMLGIIAIILFVLAIVLVVESFTSLKKAKSDTSTNV